MNKFTDKEKRFHDFFENGVFNEPLSIKVQLMLFFFIMLLIIL